MKTTPFRLTLLCISLAFAAYVDSTAPVAAAGAPDRPRQRDPETAAQRMIRSSETSLKPVYAPLAEQIVADFDLAERDGIGIDLGSGPGTLIVELSRRTPMYWINADINPHFFPHFFRIAEDAGVGDRVGAIRADAQSLPFRDNYADVVVSRGSFQFWENKPKAFAEIRRVLKPGGVAFIGRGFARDLDPAVARAIRAKQNRGGSFPKYDPEETEKRLRGILEEAGIKAYRIERPVHPDAPEINYGIWVTFRKPLQPPTM